MMASRVPLFLFHGIVVGRVHLRHGPVFGIPVSAEKVVSVNIGKSIP